MAVEASSLTVQRGRQRVLDDVNLSIARGQVTGLLGPSGSGKTTLMRAIVGVQAKVSGDLFVLGATAGAKRLRRRVAYATQAASVYDDLTVKQNLHYFARALGVARAEAERVLHLVGLAAYANQRVDSLSGGQRGRVSLAAALLGSPDLIVLDEPTVGLDPVLRAELWDLFQRLAEDGTTLLISSHVMDEALRCDRLLLMREGRIIADTTPRDLLDSTGMRDPEAAFLAIVEAEKQPGSEANLAEPRARHAVTRQRSMPGGDDAR